jgi:hypothetical protein
MQHAGAEQRAKAERDKAQSAAAQSQSLAAELEQLKASAKDERQRLESVLADLKAQVLRPVAAPRP